MTWKSQSALSHHRTPAALRARRLLLETLESRELMFADPTVIDIDDTSNTLFDQAVTVGNKFVYFDTDFQHGAEPRIYDPVTNTSALLADVNPGPGDSIGEGPFQMLDSRATLVAAGTKVYFVAHDPLHGRELRWIDFASNDLALHTLDADSGTGDSGVNDDGNLLVANNRLYFNARTDDGRVHLRWFDTTFDEPIVHTINMPNYFAIAGSVIGLNLAGNRIFFDTSGNQSTLCWIDATTDSSEVESFNLPAGTRFGNNRGYAIGSKLYFTTITSGVTVQFSWIDTSEDFPALHTIDGFIVGIDNYSSIDNNYTTLAATIGSKLFFVGTDVLTGDEQLRWIESDDPTGTVRTVLQHRTSRHYFTHLTVVGNNLYFGSYGPATYLVKWIDTTEQRPILHTLDTTLGNGQRFNPLDIMAVGSKVFFTGTMAGAGTELLWVDDSDAARAVHKIDVAPGAASSTPLKFVVSGERLFFIAQTNAATGYDLQWIDTTENAPTVTSVDVSSSNGSSQPSQLTPVGTKLYFQANSTLHWLDTNDTTKTVYDVGPDAMGRPIYPSSLEPPILVGIKLYFSDIEGNLNWIDTTRANPTVNSISVGPDGIFGLVLSGTRLYFFAKNSLYFIDTAANFPKVIPVYEPGSSDAGVSYIYRPVASNGKIFFFATDASRGTELRWVDARSNKPILHTIEVAPGKAGSDRNASGPMQVAGNRIYFDAFDVQHGTELRWIDTSLPQPVVHTLDAAPGPTSGAFQDNNKSPALVGNKLYFGSRSDSGVSYLNWVDIRSNSDTIRRVQTGKIFIDPSRLAVVGTKLYFSATAADFTLGWIDVTAARPTLSLVDFAESSSVYNLSKFVVDGHKVFFTAGSEHGNELHWLDASLANQTIHTYDIAAGSASSSPGEIAVIHGNLFFSASKVGYGNELFTAPVNTGVLSGFDSVSGTWYGSNLQNGHSQVIAQWEATAGWRDGLVGDFNGDGLSDIAARNAGGKWYIGIAQDQGATLFQRNAWAPSTSKNFDEVKIADVNNDGKDDIVAYSAAAGSKWFVFKSTGSGFNAQIVGYSSRLTWTDFLVADFNGDGRDDIAARARPANGAKTTPWYASIASGAGQFGPAKVWGRWAVKVWTDVAVADYNGDGKADIVGRISATGEWHEIQSDGGKFVDKTLGKWQANAGWQSVFIADLNGDGKDDIVGRDAAGTWNWIHQEGTKNVFTAGLGAWAPAANFKSVFAADVDGDGKDELLGRRVSTGVWRIDSLRSDAKKLVTHNEPRLQPDWDESVDWTYAALGNDDGNLF